MAPGQVMELDFENRDPNNINGHLQVCFEDVIAEADHTHSINCIWSNSYSCFNCGKNLCYRLLTTLCGLCIALAWGCDFALVAFNHVWCYTPCNRDFTICCGCIKRVFATVIGCCCDPLCASWGMFFNNIRITKA